MPTYAFAYSIEMVQFYFENSTDNLDANILDHTIIARTHAQSIASLIAEELRMNEHSFDEADSVFELLVRHNKLVTVEYSSDSKHEQALMPAGMRRHDLYVL